MTERAQRVCRRREPSEVARGGCEREGRGREEEEEEEEEGQGSGQQGVGVRS